MLFVIHALRKDKEGTAWVLPRQLLSYRGCPAPPDGTRVFLSPCEEVSDYMTYDPAFLLRLGWEVSPMYVFNAFSAHRPYPSHKAASRVDGLTSLEEQQT